MPSKWSADPPDFPAQFSSERLEAMRVLLRVACGTRSPAFVIPELPDNRKNRRLEDKRSMEGRRTWVFAKCGDTQRLTKPSIDNFKSSETNLDFSEKSPTRYQKISRIYYYLYKFFGHDPGYRTLVHALIGQVYFPDDHATDEVSVGLHKYIGIHADTIERSEKAVSGVYYLYRYGTVVQGEAEVVRSVVRIAILTSDMSKKMRFTIVYKRGDMREMGELNYIEGVVLPVRDRLFFAATDQGTGESPCLMITRFRGEGSRPQQITGMLFRVNTLGPTAATRVFLKRLTTPEQEQSTATIDEIFKLHEPNADILPSHAPSTQQEIASFSKYIDNRVDGITRFMLTDE